jgi:hypothetical protein
MHVAAGNIVFNRLPSSWFAGSNVEQKEDDVMTNYRVEMT